MRRHAAQRACRSASGLPPPAVTVVRVASKQAVVASSRGSRPASCSRRARLRVALRLHGGNVLFGLFAGAGAAFGCGGKRSIPLDLDAMGAMTVSQGVEGESDEPEHAGGDGRLA